MVKQSDLLKYHKQSSFHRDEMDWIFGCFYCLRLGNVDLIKEWIDGGQSGLCPFCGIDSLIPWPASRPTWDLYQLLKAMHKRWFEGGSTYAMEDGKARLVTSGEFHEEDLNLRELQRSSYEMAAEKGFWDDQANVPTKLALVHAEVSEALEEYRKNKIELYHVDGKPEGLGVELADAVIRIADLAEHLKVDLASLIRIKMRYNKTRPFKHGNKKI